METRQLNVTIEQARKWYTSNVISLQNLALELYTKTELEYPFTSIKSFYDACDALGYKDTPKIFAHLGGFNNSYSMEKVCRLMIIRDALNTGYYIDPLNKNAAIPLVAHFKKIEDARAKQEKNPGTIIKNIIYNSENYYLVCGMVTSYCCITSHCDIIPAIIGCATREIAEYMSKQFAKEIFDLCYSGLIYDNEADCWHNI
jgi:hypothetical protein